MRRRHHQTLVLEPVRQRTCDSADGSVLVADEHRLDELEEDRARVVGACVPENNLIPLVPVLLIGLCVDYALQITGRYREDLHLGLGTARTR